MHHYELARQLLGAPLLDSMYLYLINIILEESSDKILLQGAWEKLIAKGITPDEPVEEPGAQSAESCPCRELEEHIAFLLGIRSPRAGQHLHNARIEMLKAMRSVIDERIEHLSRPGAKGTRIAVD